MTGPSRRPRAAGGRPHKVTVQFSEKELEMVAAAAARAGQAPGAWLGEAGVRAAESGQGAVSAWGPAMQALMVLRAELMDGRRLLRNVGGNLNDVARHANSTGELPAETQQVQALVARVVERLDQTVRNLDLLASDARRERLRSRP